MRFAPLAVFAVAAASLACSDPVPRTPRGAWVVSLTQPDPIKCPIAGQVAQIGSVDQDTDATRLKDGEDGADLSCEVIGSKSFEVSAKMTQADKFLNISIPKIEAGATKDSPASGSASFSSAKTAGVTYGGSCDFYFEGKESIATGKIWMSFNCDELQGPMDTACPLTQGYAIFENCNTVSDEES